MGVSKTSFLYLTHPATTTRRVPSLTHTQSLSVEQDGKNTHTKTQTQKKKKLKEKGRFVYITQTSSHSASLSLVIYIINLLLSVQYGVVSQRAVSPLRRYTLAQMALAWFKIIAFFAFLSFFWKFPDLF